MPNTTPPSTAETDQSHIDLHDAVAVDTWAHKLQVSSDQIKEAVAQVGNSAGDVEMHLKGTKSVSNEERVEEADQSSKQNNPQNEDLTLIQRV